MKNHALRPLWLALALVALVLLFRHFMVPEDFGVHGRNFTYGFHRLSNIEEWKNFPPKYRWHRYCSGCHAEKAADNQGSRHRDIQCENCHGPAIDHPGQPEKLEINRDRRLCLRCHARLAYPTSDRSSLKGIDPQTHNPDEACCDCHNPHKPDLEDI